MSDLIDRQAAIDALRKMQTYKLFSGDDMLLIDQAGAQTELMMLPPAQLSTNLAEVGTDCISRQAAIEEVSDWVAVNRQEEIFKQGMIDILRDLPSAQPEIIACGEGELFVSGADVGGMIDRQAAIDRLTEYGNGRAVFISVGEAIIRIEQLPPAQPEPKRGRWIYKTDLVTAPTGYWECSECKEGRLLYEENFCPNCGADMREVTT